MASELSARTTFFGEISFSPRTDAGTGSQAVTGYNVEVEDHLADGRSPDDRQRRERLPLRARRVGSSASA